MRQAKPGRADPVQVDELVATLLEQKGLPPVARHRSLRDAGLKSMDVFNLMLSIEEDFEIVIPQDKMTPENFNSIASICALVETLTA